MITRVNSTIIQYIFDQCYYALVWLAACTGTTYEEINVICFCIVWPIFTLTLMGVCLYQWLKIREAKKALNFTIEVMANLALDK